MAQMKPDCKDFILATLRKIRLTPSNMKEGTKAGTSLHRLSAIALDVYSEAEFRQGLEDMLQNKTLVATWRIVHVSAKDVWGRVHSELIKSIPANMPLDQGSWRRGMEDETVGRTKHESVEHDLVLGVKLYVAEDGLPQHVSKLSKKRAGASAEQIIAEMQKSE